MTRFIARAFGLLGVAIAAGCGGKDASSPVPVSGVLKHDGRPLAGAVVGFHPEAPNGKPAFGTTGEDGKFRLTTDSPGDGVLPGKYKVVIQPPVGGGGSPFDDPAKATPTKAPAGPKVPEKYTRLDRTPLTQDVPPNGEVVIDIPAK